MFFICNEGLCLRGKGVIIIEKAMIFPVDELDGMEVDTLILQVDTLKGQDGLTFTSHLVFCLLKKTRWQTGIGRITSSKPLIIF